MTHVRSSSEAPARKRTAQIDFALVEQAPAEVAVGREARAIAGAAERLAHGRDDADAPRPLFPAFADGKHARRLVEAERLERKLGAKLLANYRRRNHAQISAPVVSLEWHIFNIANFDGPLASERPRQSPPARRR